MDQSEPARRRRTTAIVAAAGLACLAIAIPVSGAFADGDGNNSTSGTLPVQNQQYGDPGYGQGAPQAPPRQGAPDGNCPKDHQNQGNPPSNGGQGNNESGTTLPGDTVDL
jgi:hypothetical protein